MGLYLFTFLGVIVPALVSVAFVTLVERKVLGLAQARKGPNKVSVGGLLQPFADAVKLLAKEPTVPASSLKAVFYLSPIIGLMLILLMWLILPVGANCWSLSNSLLFFLTGLSLTLYPLLLAGWSSNSAYAMVGGLRGVAQTISYEVSLALLLLSVFMLCEGTSFLAASLSSIYGPGVALLSPLLVLWLISCVAETNRTPFDFAEGESELVSGFNIEYGAGGFVLIFMTEYASILFLSAITSFMFISQSSVSALPVSVLISCLWLWLRATLPRYRYDKLMGLAWKSILPEALCLLLFFCCISMF